MTKLTKILISKPMMLALAAAGVTMTVYAGAQAQQPQYPAPGGGFALPSQQPALPPLPVEAAITPNGAVVEDVVARVNDRIITRSEYERSEQELAQEAQQANVPPADLASRQSNMLRDMIDQQLLLSKGKDLGINCDAETIKQLDEIRKQNHLDSMEALEKAATAQGVSYEDFKNNIRNGCITKQVVGDEVGRKLQLTQAQEEAYYKEHADQFQQPEQVHLSEILVPTSESPTDADLAAAKAKADAAETQLKAGKSFADVAKAFSGGPTATAGGDLGDFKRGTLGQVLEDATFALPVGGVTAPIRTRQGFVILRADSHTQAGVAPLSAVEQQVQEAIYVDQLQPALRAYLTKARAEAYIDIKPGFIDTGATKAESKPVFTTYKPPPVKKKQVEHQRLEKEQNARAQQELAQAKQDAAAKAARAAAKSSGATNASMPAKPKKIHREKIRYGQAPRNSLPAGTETASDGGAANSPPAGQAPGALISQTETTTVLTAGTGATEDPLAPATGPQRKTRFSSRQSEIELTRAQEQVAKAQERAAAHPAPAAPAESAAEKQQAAPLGLNGDTASKVKPAHTSGTKERLQEQQKPAPVPAQPIAPTVNPAIVTTPAALQPAAPPKSSNQTTLPPVDSGATPLGQPPATEPVPTTPPQQ